MVKQEAEFVIQTISSTKYQMQTQKIMLSDAYKA